MITLVEMAGSCGHSIDEQVFRFLLDLELEKALRLQYCVAVVCFKPDLPRDEVDSQFSRRIAEAAVRQLRGTDVATTLPQSTVGLLLIDADSRAVRHILDRTVEAVQTQAKPGERLSLSAGASCYPETVSSGKDLLGLATDLMVRARAEGGDRLYLSP
ncbi:MAG: hypothetical protein ACRELA_15580 [Candidatus Rokuibacteriota bacterium]